MADRNNNITNLGNSANYSAGYIQLGLLVVGGDGQYRGVDMMVVTKIFRSLGTFSFDKVRFEYTATITSTNTRASIHPPTRTTAISRTTRTAGQIQDEDIES